MRIVHTCRQQHLELLAVLDAFGRRRNAETPRQREHGSHHGATVPPIGGPLRDRPVDLDLVEREARERARRGISAAAIIEHDRDAKVSQLPDDEQILIPLQQRRVGYFEFQPVRRQPGLDQRA